MRKSELLMLEALKSAPHLNDTVVVCENFVTRKGPSTPVIDATSFVLMRNATIKAEELANISSYQTL
jgi:hypothetical protein